MGDEQTSRFETTVRDAHRASREGVALVDIRDETERLSGAAAGSVFMTADQVRARLREERGWAANILCAGGARSLILAVTLQRAGCPNVRSVAGGFERWNAAGLPVEHPHSHEADRAERYARQRVMPQVGAEGQRRLRRARVLLAGLGGLNSPVALYLAAAGVGTLGLADHDRVERSNLQRQVLHGEAAVGERKTKSAAGRLADLNPDVNTEVIDQRIDAANAARLLRDWDLVVDGTDNFAARHAMNEACVAAGIPLVYGAVMQFQGQVSVFWPAGRPGEAPCLHCLLPPGAPATGAPSCSEAGVLGVMPGIVGLLQAAEAIKLLLRIGEPLIGQLLMVDALTMEFRKAKIHPARDCPVCADLDS